MKISIKKLLKPTAFLMLALLFTMAACTLGGTGPTTPEPYVAPTPLPTNLPAIPEIVDGAEDASRETTGEFTCTYAEPSSGLQQNGSNYIIRAAGEYVFTGRLEEGQIAVNVGDDDRVTIELNNVYISSSKSAPILGVNADKLTVRAAEDSYNVIRDTRSENDLGENVSAIFSNCDLKLRGTGTLVVSSEHGGGVRSKDDLSVKEVNLKVSSNSAALRGNDSVSVESGTLLLISADGTGIKTTSTDISNKGKQRGTVTISGGSVTICSAGDGINAAYNAELTSAEAELTILAGSYAGHPNRTSPAIGIHAENEVIILDGKAAVYCNGDGVHVDYGTQLENGSVSTGIITCAGGSLSICCEDDAIHAGGAIVLSGCKVDIPRAHEGLEANTLTLSGGSLTVVAEDDGINAQNGRNEPVVEVKGGVLDITVGTGDTDAIDSNGNFIMSGGFAVVRSGGSATGAGSVEVKGRVSVTGGTLLAFGQICDLPADGSVNGLIARGKTFASGDYQFSGAEGAFYDFSLSTDYTSCWLASDRLELGGDYSLTAGGAPVLGWNQSAWFTESSGN